MWVTAFLINFLIWNLIQITTQCPIIFHFVFRCNWKFNLDTTDKYIHQSDVNEDLEFDSYTEEHRLFAMYFHHVVQFEHFKQKSHKYKMGQAGAFLAFQRYCATHKDADVCRTLNFQCDEAFGSYGSGNDSMVSFDFSKLLRTCTSCSQL